MLIISQVTFDSFNGLLVTDYAEQLRHYLMIECVSPLVLLDQDTSLTTLVEFVGKLAKCGFPDTIEVSTVALRAASIEAFWDPAQGDQLRLWMIGESNPRSIVARIQLLEEEEG